MTKRETESKFMGVHLLCTYDQRYRPIQSRRCLPEPIVIPLNSNYILLTENWVLSKGIISSIIFFDTFIVSKEKKKLCICSEVFKSRRQEIINLKCRKKKQNRIKQWVKIICFFCCWGLKNKMRKNLLFFFFSIQW